MLFNSDEFLLFISVFCPVYWLVHRNNTFRNVLVLTGSYFFYASWDWRFLSLLIASTVVDFIVGAKIAAAEGQVSRRHWIILSVVVNLGFLGTFKYFDFFVTSFADLLNGLGVSANLPLLNVVLPVGISFYTFQSLSYTIDIYRGNCKPARSLLTFASFVAFFPQLVAGPIERARSLLPQIEGPVALSLAKVRDGAWLILWGLCKKVLIADRVAVYVDGVYAAPDAYSAATCVTATLLFAVQIYCDFSGYSDIARGLAKLLGVELMVNFDTPYFARSIREFWRRWHISLSTWFRDYVFIPLGGSKKSEWMTNRNLFITFVVSGVWHGAAYTFLIWGILHGVARLVDPFSRDHISIAKSYPRFWGLLGWAATFLFVNVAWIFFRADSLSDAVTILGTIASPSSWLMSDPEMAPFWEPVAMNSSEMGATISLLGLLLVTDWLVRGKGIDKFMSELPAPISWAYSWMLLSAFFLMPPSETGAFIYFQF